ncbi:MAG TPA: FAD:protein FMN transferase [Methyloradius sp.]
MKRARPLLGTYVEIEANGLNDDCLQLAINAAFAAIDKVQTLMSVHDHRSQLSRLNRHAFGRQLRVHPWLFEVLQMAVKLHKQTGGRFDCTIAPALKRLGYLTSMSVRKIRNGNSADIDLKPAYRVRFTKRLSIDLGGIAKGFAVDKAVEALKKHGASSATVNAGGDLRVYGNIASPVFLRKPENPAQLVEVGQLQNGAMATSASYFSKRRHGQQDRSALINAKAKSKAKTSLVTTHSYSVIAPSCMLADGLTKALIFSGHSSTAYMRKYKARSLIL